MLKRKIKSQRKATGAPLLYMCGTQAGGLSLLCTFPSVLRLMTVTEAPSRANLIQQCNADERISKILAGLEPSTVRWSPPEVPLTFFYMPAVSIIYLVLAEVLACRAQVVASLVTIDVTIYHPEDPCRSTALSYEAAVATPIGCS
jgi:hypothetical protein